MITTITPVWNRREMLLVWLEALKGATLPEVRHLVIFVGEPPPPDWHERTKSFPQIRTVVRMEHPWRSIGRYHNIGAGIAETPWMMKLDVDCLPNMNFFKDLLPVLENALPGEWFNCGMFCTTQETTRKHLTFGMPVRNEVFERISWDTTTRVQGFSNPGSTQFICRREDYLKLGGCDDRFAGWGWEDYQQIYMLEKFWKGADPLPGDLTLTNVTNRCRDEIARPKALALWVGHPTLVLLHRWHLRGGYARNTSEANRRVLLDYINTHRS